MGFLNNLFQGISKPEVAIYESDQEAPKDQAYRLRKDPENLIRIRQDYVTNSQKQWDTLEDYWGLHVAGVTHREESVISFISGDNRQIELSQEPTPKHPHAIAVYGKWADNKNRCHREQLGFVPNEDAKDIYKRRKKTSEYLLSSRLNRMYAPTKEKNAGIVFDVILLEPRWPRFEIHGIGKKSGRKRKKTYRAKTLDEALNKAYTDDMIVDIQASKEII